MGFRPARRLFLISLAFATACASAGDRLNEGIELQAQGRYMAAAYRYADAVEKDGTLVEARERLVIVGDSAIMVALDEADRSERRGEPVAAARQFQAIDRLLARVRSVGLRLTEPTDYRTARRDAFDQAIEWFMSSGHDASREGRWSDARRAFAGARRDFDPSRSQVEASYGAEERLVLDWAEIELSDDRPRAAYGIAGEALEVRSSPPRAVVVEVRDLQKRALDMGTVVIATLPVTAAPSVRDVVGAEFEIQLDEDLGGNHWRDAPLFVAMADPLILRRELRGLLRGRISQSPTIVGRALNLIGADYGVMIEVTSVDVFEEDVRLETRTAYVVTRNGRNDSGRVQDECQGRGQGRGQERGRGQGPCRGQGRGRGQDTGQGVTPQQVEVGDTVTFTVVTGRLAYRANAEIRIVDLDGRTVARFDAVSREAGPFRRAEFDGDPWQLDLSNADARLFDWNVQEDQWLAIERPLLRQLARAISVGTFEELLRQIP